MSNLKLYKIYRDFDEPIFQKYDYDSYDSAVVCARSGEEARRMNPNGSDEPVPYSIEDMDWVDAHEWRGASDVKVEYLGEAARGIEKGVIVSSFNAG